MSKYARILVKKFWGICAVLLIATAVLVQLGRELTPLAGDYRVDVSRYLSKQLGVNVSIDALSAQWSGLLPQLRLSGLRLSTTDGVEILSIKGAAAQLSLLNSLWRWRLAWGQIKLTQVQMAFKQDADGQWNLVGLPKTTATPISATKVTIDDPLDVFLIGNHVELTDATLQFVFRTGHKTQVKVPHILLENSATFHRLSTDLSLDEQESTLQFVLEGKGDPRDRESFQAKGYLQIKNFPLGKNLAAIDEKRWQDLPEGQTVDAQLWLASVENGGFNFHGQISVDGIPFPPALTTDMDLPTALSSLVSGHWLPAEGWRFGLQQMQLHWRDEVSPKINLIIEHGPNRPPAILSDKIALDDWLGVASRHGFFSGRLGDVLNTLDPKGVLHNLQLQFDNTGEQPDFKLRANMEKVSAEAWSGAPAVRGIDGYIEASRRGGFVEIHSREGFMMHYRTIYAEPMHYKTMSGHVAWHLRPQDNAIYVNSGPLSLRNEEEIADGYFHLYMPWKKGSAVANLVLQIGLQNSHAAAHNKYVPFKVPSSLRSWLQRSLSEGSVSDGGFIYNGSISRKKIASRALQLYLNVQGASLDYHRDWPGLTGIDGLLIMDDKKLSVRVNKAQLYDCEVGPTRVTLQPNLAGRGGLLHIKGAVRGDASDGLKVLRESRIRHYIADNLDEWRINGDMQVDVALSIPLVADQPGAVQKVQVNLANTSLSMDKLQLGFSHLQGKVGYSSENGLVAKALTGELWDQPINISLSSPGNAKGGRDIEVNLQGSVDAAQLARWGRRPEMLFADGKLNYLAQLRIPSKAANLDHAALLHVSSDLQGITIDLPYPYGKSAAEAFPMQMKVPIKAGKVLYDIRYRGLVHALFLDREGALENALVVLGKAKPGKKVRLPAKAAFKVSGRPEKLVLSQWPSVLERYQQYERELSKLGNQPRPLVRTKLRKIFDVDVNTLQVSELELTDIHIKGERFSDRWQLQMNNRTLAGDMIWFDGETKPATLQLKYLRLPETDKASATTSGDGADKDEDLMADWDLTDIPRVDVAAEEFSIGEENYGQWSFKLRPLSSGLIAKDISAVVKGAKVTGLKADSGAQLRWQRKGDKSVSDFSGRIVVKDLATVLQAWKQPALMSSESATFDADMSWLGSPAALSMKNLTGNLYMDVKKGRFNSTSGKGSNPLFRLVGLFNFNTWARRLELDFSDLYKGGMAYDKISGEMRFKDGLIYLAKPVKVSTPSSLLQMAGTIDMKQEQLDGTLVATLPVGGNLTLLTAIAAGLPAAAGVYVASKIFKKQVDKVGSASYRMTGPWSDPKVSFERLFDDKAAKRAGQDTEKDVHPNGHSDSEPVKPKVNEDQVKKDNRNHNPNHNHAGEADRPH